jgi:hypothetical protein
MLADVLAGESPAGGTRPVATVVIPGGEKGDRLAGSPEVKVSVGSSDQEGAPTQGRKGQWVIRPRGRRVRSTREASKSAGCSKVRTDSSEIGPHTRSGRCGYRECRALFRWAKASASGEGTGHKQPLGSPGWVQDDMPTKNAQRKHGTTRWSLRPAGTAKTRPISRGATKWARAGEWGGWGRLSVDGPGHYNPDRSEGPWGRGEVLEQRYVEQQNYSDSEPRYSCCPHVRRVEAN